MKKFQVNCNWLSSIVDIDDIDQAILTLDGGERSGVWITLRDKYRFSKLVIGNGPETFIVLYFVGKKAFVACNPSLDGGYRPAKINGMIGGYSAQSHLSFEDAVVCADHFMENGLVSRSYKWNRCV